MYLSGDAIGGESTVVKQIEEPRVPLDARTGLFRANHSLTCFPVEQFRKFTSALTAEAILHGPDTARDEFVFVWRSNDDKPTLYFTRTADKGKSMCIFAQIDLFQSNINMKALFQIFNADKNGMELPTREVQVHSGARPWHGKFATD